ncbi:MAG: energy transducer TonB [Acidobacteria bacterium]|nr:energy transducer TonB [Acidobacteriota bacterium]
MVRAVTLFFMVFLVSTVFSQGGPTCLVKLEVEISATGKVGNIENTTESTCTDSNLIEKAREAARKITFEPNIVDGKAVAASKHVEYTFTPISQPVDEKAAAVIAKAIQALGGDKYLQARSQVSRGSYTILKAGTVVSFQTFTDAIVYPDRERTDFKNGGVKTVQVNTGNTGWVYDGDQDKLRNQTERQIANFKEGLRTSIDYLLRGGWKEGELTYVGKRPSTLGKRNDVIRLKFPDGFTVEFEFADDGTPAKAIYKTKNIDGDELTEEDRYAQFVDVNGIKAPFIIDRFTNGAQTSRLNFDSVEFNKEIAASAFVMPSNPKDAKKDIKY